MIKAIVFDFDGVIAPHSEFFKQEAWRSVFLHYGEAYLPHFREAEAKYGGGQNGDRYDILRHTYRGLGEPEERIGALVRDGSEKFERYVREKVTGNGAGETARFLSALGRKYPLYVNSATPTEPLRRTVGTMGLNGVFKKVLGRPFSKADNFKRIAAEESAAPAEVLFIGDSEGDWGAAQEFGCQFIGIANEWNRWRGPMQFPLINRLPELVAYLRP